MMQLARSITDANAQIGSWFWTRIAGTGAACRESKTAAGNMAHATE